MAGTRTLKLSILADIDDLKKNLSQGDKEIEGFGSKLGEFGKKAAAAFAVAAAAAVAYAGKLAIDGVKAAIEDQAAQEKLANALRNVTGATDRQIASVEDQITKMSLAFGVADDKLRPAFQRLATATGDLDEASKNMTLALDISAATGKSVEAVANSLGKAYEGNTSALGRLGIGLSSAELKSMTLEQVTQKLSDTFGGAATTQADTFQGRIARIQVAFDEAKETIGTAFLPIVEKLLTFVTDKIVPGFTALSNAIGGKGGAIKENFEAVGDVIETVFLPIFERAKESFTVVWKLLKDNFTPVLDAFKGAWDKISTALENQKENIASFLDTFQEVYEWLAKTLIPLVKVTLVAAFNVAGTALSKAFDVLIPVLENVFSFVKTVINGIIDGINLLIKGINLVKPGADIGLIPKIGEGSSSAGLGNRPFGVGAPGGGSTGRSDIATPGSFAGAGGSGSSGGAGGGGQGLGTPGSNAAAGPTPDSSDPYGIGGGGWAQGQFIPGAGPTMPFEPVEPLYGVPMIPYAPSTGLPAGSAQNVNGVTIIVQGPSLIDAEGFKNAVVDALNEATNRGTGGGASIRDGAIAL